MSNGALTDAAHWAAYWETKQPERISADWYYAALLRSVVAGRGYTSLLELGGFPGYFAVYARRYLGFRDVALVDSFVDPRHMQAVLATNGLEAGDVDVHEGDMFDVELPARYDVVLSAGLVEHFSDPTEALARHRRWLAPGGVVVVTVPNFRGLNGIVQRVFDPAGLAQHNRELMSPDALAQALARAASLESVDGFYFGPFRAWVEPGASLAARAAVFGVLAMGTAIDRFLPRTRLTGRDVVAVGRRT